MIETKEAAFVYHTSNSELTSKVVKKVLALQSWLLAYGKAAAEEFFSVFVVYWHHQNELLQPAVADVIC